MSQRSRRDFLKQSTLAGVGFWVGGSAPTHIGQQGDVPVMANYRGLSSLDYAVWRPSTGMWFVATNPTGC